MTLLDELKFWRSMCVVLLVDAFAMLVLLSEAPRTGRTLTPDHRHTTQYSEAPRTGRTSQISEKLHLNQQVSNNLRLTPLEIHALRRPLNSNTISLLLLA